jgi:hypothetical protein
VASRARSTLARVLIEQKRYADAEENMRNALSSIPDHQTTAGAFWMRWTLIEALLIQVKIRECTDDLAPRWPDTLAEMTTGHQGGCPRACTTPA